MVVKLLSYISGVTRKPYEERLKAQLAVSSQNALEDCHDLQTGKLEPINSYTEPKVEVKLDPHAAVMEAILRNPLKQELFIIWADAEERSNISTDEEDKLSMSKLYSILTPVFTNPELHVGDEEFAEYMRQASELGYFPEGARPVSGEGRVRAGRGSLRPQPKAQGEAWGDAPALAEGGASGGPGGFPSPSARPCKSCPFYEHYLEHITKEGDEYDCLQPVPVPAPWMGDPA